MHLLDLAPTAIVAAAIAPALLLLWLVVAADNRPEPPSLVWSAFILGASSLFILRYIRPLLLPTIPMSPNPWLAVDEYSILAVGIPEETVKILIITAVLAIAVRVRALDEPMDCVVYGAAVGLGFAAHENLGYLVKSADWETLAVVRGVLTVPFHGALGALAGAYLGRAWFAASSGLRVQSIALAWFVPVLLHTLFDIPLLDLRRNLAGEALRPALEALGLVVTVSAIAFAVWLAWRVGSPKEMSRDRYSTAWRSLWVLLVISAAIGFVGVDMIASSVQQLHAPIYDRLFSFSVGSVLLLLAVVLFGRGHKYLYPASTQRQPIDNKR